MPKESKLTGELLSDTLLNVSCLIGEARDVSVSLAKGGLPMERVKELSKQAARDLSSADKLLNRIMDELREAERPSN